ncbi:MAG: glycosyl hydrolase, partial [Chryseobacterium sp.]|nr:glycosyl hydrolase [Chryseobacterium sp.]
MSFRINQYLNYSEKDSATEDLFFKNKSEIELQHLFTDILQSSVHGLCFSLYEQNQKPGDIISEEQIRRRIEKIKPYTKWVRSFSCTEGNELIPKIAKEYGMKTLVGAWLGNEKDKNQEEMDALIQLYKDGFVDIASVGNEVLYREDLTEDELLENIQYVKDAIPDCTVGYV